jgi:hypothetical protein
MLTNSEFNILKGLYPYKGYSTSEPTVLFKVGKEQLSSAQLINKKLLDISATHNGYVFSLTPLGAENVSVH